jgi:hypothetical protein
VNEERYLDFNYKSKHNKDVQIEQEARTKLWRAKASDNGNVGARILEYFRGALTKERLRELLIGFRVLGTSVGTYVMCGRVTRVASFTSLTVEEKEIALIGLANSPIASLRQLFKAIRNISLLITYGASSENGSNNAWVGINYPGNEKLAEEKRKQEKKLWDPSFIDIKNAQKSSSGVVELECDVVVVGSGAGGGVIAAELSMAGHKVIVVDRASYFPVEKSPENEKDAMTTSFESSGGFYSEDMSMFIMAGDVWGGGTSINWSACLEPPANVRKEWASEYGLSYFDTPAYQNAIDVISARIGVSDKITHNIPNQLMMKGCEKLNYPCKPVPQNTSGLKHECGHCSFGCPNGVKQNSSRTWLNDAADHGCKFIDGMKVNHILHKNNFAYGVVGTKNGVLVKIRAKKVVSSCGSIQTPALLMRSNFKNLNPHVGKHLRLHPVSIVLGTFADLEVKPHEGAILTTVSNLISDLDGNGYGAKIEVAAMHPGNWILIRYVCGFKLVAIKCILQRKNGILHT